MHLKDYLEKNEKWHMWVVLVLAALFSFWRLGTHSVSEWDEARYGEIAHWMNERGDFINYQYAGTPDSWNAKPPLVVWLIAGSFRVFGENEWALRFPSALAIISFFALFYRFVRVYQSSVFAVTCCLILMACSGLIGHHVGRTGDTDAYLVVCLMAFLYAMALYLEQNRPGAIILAGISLGLAFYAKGTTFVFYVPGVFLYVLLRGKMLSLLRDYHFWISLGLLIGIIGSWYMCVTQLGQTFESETHLGKNSWEVMILYDTFHRFTTPGVEGHPDAGTDYGFFFSALDIKFNLWNYLCYLGIILGGILGWKSKSGWWEQIKASKSRLMLLATLLLLSQGLILTISQSKLVWYIAPVLPFAAIWAVWFMQRSIRWQSWLMYVWIGLWIFCMSRQVISLHYVKEDRGQLLRKYRSEMVAADQIWIYKASHQDIRLYADWYNQSVDYLIRWENWEERLQSGQVLIAKLSVEEKEKVWLHPGMNCISSGGVDLIWRKEGK